MKDKESKKASSNYLYHVCIFTSTERHDGLLCCLEYSSVYKFLSRPTLSETEKNNIFHMNRAKIFDLYVKLFYIERITQPSYYVNLKTLAIQE